ncbi:MAG: AraC family transcriptional regulator [Acidimicrobiales bacterium]
MAQRCGFGSAATFRSHFRRQMGTTPLAYRVAFRRAA